MNVRTISLIALCATLTACNSKTPEPTAAPSESVGEAGASSAPVTTASVAMKPAPEGLPSRIAKEVVAASGLKCDGIAKASRDAKDGTIVASCTGGENYRIYTEEGKGPVAIAL